MLGLSCDTQDLCCVSWDLSLWHMDSLDTAWDSVIAARRLSYSTGCGVLVPWPGIEPMPPALQGGFSATGTGISH